VYLSPLIIGSLFMGFQKKVKSTHPESKLNKPIFVGYSWTYFFFGFFVPIFRGEIVVGLLHAILSFITFGLFWLIMSFLYNRQYSERLIASGWQLSDTEERNQMVRLKLRISDQ
tara:strand:+ start:3326 stop:3667 length:342 start_codon:yes stop_codon:yes gene_type:complete